MNGWTTRSMLAAGLAAMLLGSTATAARDLAAPARPQAAPASPEALFGPLYVEVEMRGLFPDSKTFADAVPL
ncbi:MAG: hypothetical protein WA840_18080, partial [Caulobacteraceae bacterium]